jgi:integrase
MSEVAVVTSKPRLVYSAWKAERPTTLADLLHRYIRETAETRGIGESQQHSMEKAARLPIGRVTVEELRAEHFVDLGRLLSRDAPEFNHQAVQPQTVTAYMTYMHVVVEMLPLWRVPRAKEIAEELEQAKVWLEKLRLIGKGRPREQRMSLEEQAVAEAYFTSQEARWPTLCVAPMLKIMRFALTSLRRQSEITRVLWTDLEAQERMLTVRDMKDPRYKVGNHFRFPLLDEAFDIVMSMPRVAPQIFPFNPHSLSQRWHEAMADLHFPIHFHDLRREGICRMFEAGYGAQEVAGVSGHKNWNTLARVYANKFNPADLHRGPVALRVANSRLTPVHAATVRSEAIMVAAQR